MRVVIIVMLLIGLMIAPGAAQAQGASCDVGDTETARNQLTSEVTTVTAEQSGYVLLSSNGLYYYSVDGGAGQQRTTPVRVGLVAGSSITYRLLTATEGTAIHCARVLTPTSVAYPVPVTATPGSAPTSTASAAPEAAYPAPTPLPTVLPDATLGSLGSHGQAVTAVGASPVGVAIVAVFALWLGLRLLVGPRRRR